MLNNTVTLIGRLTRDVEVKKTSTGKSVAYFTIAIDNGKDKAGNERPADFLDCQAWDKSADNLGLYAHKGNLLVVQGELKTRSYDKKDGTKAKVSYTLVREWKNLSPKSSSSISTVQPVTAAPEYPVEESFDSYMDENNF